MTPSTAKRYDALLLYTLIALQRRDEVRRAKAPIEERIEWGLIVEACRRELRRLGLRLRKESAHDL